MTSVAAPHVRTRIVPVLDGTVHRVDLPGHGTVVLAPGRDYTGVRFTDINLDGLTLTDCNFDGAVLDNCRLGGTDLSRSSFNRAVLSGCDLDDPSFFWCSMEGTQFLGCTSTALRLAHCRIEGAVISGRLDGVRIRNCTFTGTRFTDAVMNGLTVHFTTFRDCVMERSWMMESQFGKVSFGNCVVDRTSLWKTVFFRVTLQACRFVSAGFNESSLISCAWNDTAFHSCRFRLLEDLTGHVTRCTFERCSFEETDLTEATFDDCRFLVPSHSMGTRWPDGLEPGTDPLPV